MATSSNWSTSNGYIVYYADVNTISQDINNNRSIVNVKIYVKRTNTGYETYGNGTVYLNVDGQTRSSGITSSQSITSTPRLIHDENYTIGHNSDGSKTIYIQSYISHDRFSSSWQGFDVSLSTIPRTSPVWVNVSSANAGTQVTVSVNRAVSSFTHSAHMVINGSIYGICVKSTATSWNWTIPIEVINHIPSSTSGNFTIYCDTFNGNTHLGTSSTTLTVNVPNNIVPSFSSLSLERVDNGVPSAWATYVKGKSKVKYTVNSPSGSYGSWITSYKVTGCGRTWSSQSATTEILNYTGTQTFTAIITDSRGRTASKSVNIIIYDYWNPAISSFSAKRCNSDGSLNEDGQYAKVQCDYAWADVNGKNTPNVWCKVKYRPVGGSWSSETYLVDNVAKVVGDNSISNNNTYEIQVNIGDTFTGTDRILTLPSAKVTMDFRNGGNGIAIGKVAERDGLEVDWNTSFNKGINCSNDTGINWSANGDGADITFHANSPSSTSYIKYNVRDDWDECHLFGGTHYSNGWQEWLRINSSGAEIKGNTVLHNGICKNTFTDTTTDWKEGYIQLDSTNRLYYGWITMTNTSSGWQMRTYTVPGASELYGGTLITSRPAVSIVREISGASFVCQLYEMDGNETSIRVRYMMVGR